MLLRCAAQAATNEVVVGYQEHTARLEKHKADAALERSVLKMFYLDPQKLEAGSPCFRCFMWNPDSRSCKYRCSLGWVRMPEVFHMGNPASWRCNYESVPPKLFGLAQQQVKVLFNIVGFLRNLDEKGNEDAEVCKRSRQPPNAEDEHWAR
eukprot:scaffold218308_cov18-Tisochrysis_lutea.AAC.1